ncbi:MAG: NIF family HAD-type phosphatase [Candidatus Micrarchaeaceae archaeon]
MNLIIDIDCTLIYPITDINEDISPFESYERINWSIRKNNYKYKYKSNFILRPYIDIFFNSIKDNYKLFLWSNSAKERVLRFKNFFHDKYNVKFVKVFTEDDVHGYKNLNMLKQYGCDNTNTIFLDDYIVLPLENLLPIPSFCKKGIFQKDDPTLLEVAEFLTKMTNSYNIFKDVRLFLTYSRYTEYKEVYENTFKIKDINYFRINAIQSDAFAKLPLEQTMT